MGSAAGRPGDRAARPAGAGGVDGHLLVLGTAGAGKTTLLRTLILALTRRHSPADLWIYVIDPAGAACGFATPPAAGVPARVSLPHLAHAIGATEVTKVERLLAELQGQVERRRRLLLAHNANTLTEYRARCTADPTLPPCPPALLVAIDHIAELAANEPQAIEAFKPLMRDARACGITFAVTGYSYRDVSTIQSAFELRVALRVNDPADSDQLIGKGFAARISADRPGCGFLRTGERPVELQIALPSLRASDPAGAGASGSAAGELACATAAIAAQNRNVTAGLSQPLRELPARVALADLERQAGAGAAGCGLPIAIDDLTLQPLWLDLAGATPHLLIGGGPRSGKTTLLRTILAGLARRYPPEQVQIVGIDYRRRDLAALRALPHTRQLAANESEVKALVEALAKELEARQASGDTSAPRLLLALSDWELLLGAENGALDRLAPYAIQGRDLGFHFIATSVDFAGASTSKLFRAAKLAAPRTWASQSRAARRRAISASSCRARPRSWPTHRGAAT